MRKDYLIPKHVEKKGKCIKASVKVIESSEDDDIEEITDGNKRKQKQKKSSRNNKRIKTAVDSSSDDDDTSPTKTFNDVAKDIIRGNNQPNLLIPEESTSASTSSGIFAKSNNGKYVEIIIPENTSPSKPDKKNVTDNGTQKT